MTLYMRPRTSRLLSPGHPDVLFWYDGPLLWIGYLDGRLALAMCIEDDDHGMQYMVVHVSPRRLHNVLESCTTMREAFRFPEHGEHHLGINDEHGLRCDPWPATMRVVDHLSSPGARLRPARRYKPHTRHNKYTWTIARRRRSLAETGFERDARTS